MPRSAQNQGVLRDKGRKMYIGNFILEVPWLIETEGKRREWGAF